MRQLKRRDHHIDNPPWAGHEGVVRQWGSFWDAGIAVSDRGYRSLWNWKLQGNMEATSGAMSARRNALALTLRGRTGPLRFRNVYKNDRSARYRDRAELLRHRD